MFAEKNLIKLEVYLSCAFCALVKSGDFCVLCTWRGIDKNSFPPGLTMKKRSFFYMCAPNIYLFRHDNHCPAAFLRGVDFLCVWWRRPQTQPVSWNFAIPLCRAVFRHSPAQNRLVRECEYECKYGNATYPLRKNLSSILEGGFLNGRNYEIVFASAFEYVRFINTFYRRRVLLVSMECQKFYVHFEHLVLANISLARDVCCLFIFAECWMFYSGAIYIYLSPQFGVLFRLYLYLCAFRFLNYILGWGLFVRAVKT